MDCHTKTGGGCANLLDLPKMQKTLFCKSFDNIILGLDGYLTNFLEEYEGLKWFFEICETACKNVYIATNDTIRSEDELIGFFAEKGFTGITPDNILNPVKTIITYCKHNLQGKSILSFCCDPVNCQLRDHLKIVLPLTETQGCDYDTKDFFTPNLEIGAILFDVDFNLHISHLTLAIEALTRFPNCKILVTQTRKHLPIRKGYWVLSPLAFVTVLKKFSQKQPILLGKRGAFFSCAMKRQFGIGKPCRTLFIGENFETDILFGIENGFQTILLTSCYFGSECTVMPNFVIKSLNDLACVLAAGLNLKSLGPSLRNSRNDAKFDDPERINIAKTKEA